MSSKMAGDGIDPWLYRRTCAQFATGITVVTTLDSNGHPHGMTVNSFSSVSLDPPLVLVSIDLHNAILGHFISSSWFAINVLAEHQQFLSHRFSNPAEDRFVGVQWHPEWKYQDNSFSRALFAAFGKAAREHAMRHRV